MVIDDDAEDEKEVKGGMSTSDIKALVKSMVAQGKAEGELEKYLEQNLKYRQKIRTLKDELEATNKKVPAEGAIVLAGEDAKEHGEIVALGKKAKEIKTILDGYDALVEKTAKLEREQLISKIAEAEGWKPELLDRLTKGMDLVLEDVNEDVDDGEGGTKKAQVKRGFVQKKDGTNVSEVRLSEELKELLASLTKEEASGVEQDQDSQVTDYPKQVRGETGSKTKAGSDLKGAVGKHIGSRNYAVPGKDKADK